VQGIIRKIIFLQVFITSLCLSVPLLAQKGYDSGYIITNDGTRKNVLIFRGNDYWKDNPSSIEYKESAGQVSKTATIDDIKEFGVQDFYVFRRFTTDIDYSSQNPMSMSVIMKPEYQTRTVFLDLLIDGDASIYQYKEGKLVKFFLQMDDKLQPLVYKKFMKEDKRIYGNFAYKKQLTEKFKCRDIHPSLIQKKSYKDTHLVFLAEKYNQCKGSAYTDYLKIRNKHDYYNLWVKGGLSNYSLEFEDVLGPADIDFGSASTFYAGIENELMLPYGRGNWSLVAGLNYLSIGFGTEEVASGNNYVQHNTIEINAGIKRYFPVTPDIAIFLSGQYLNDFKNSSYFSSNGKDDNGQDLSANNTYTLSGGVRWKRFYGEYRYVGERSLSENWPKYNSYFQGSSIVLGINIY
jgi:hypothetical protein